MISFKTPFHLGELRGMSVGSFSQTAAGKLALARAIYAGIFSHAIQNNRSAFRFAYMFIACVGVAQLAVLLARDAKFVSGEWQISQTVVLCESNVECRQACAVRTKE